MNQNVSVVAKTQIKTDKKDVFYNVQTVEVVVSRNGMLNLTVLLALFCLALFCWMARFTNKETLESRREKEKEREKDGKSFLVTTRKTNIGGQVMSSRP